MKNRAFLALALMLFMSPLWAAVPNLVVEGVQMPAWVEHSNGAREPLAIGAALADKDIIATGPAARALLRFADGSLVKVGENGVLVLDDLGQRKISLKNVVTATLNVASGAFRFTTQALSRFRGERDVKVKVTTITVGIRGTDVWGKSDRSRDLVCLIEGEITVARGPDAFTMDQPMSFYVAPRDAPPQPVAPVSEAQLREWSLETEISEGAGAARKGGKWKVYLFEFDNQDDALAAYDRMRLAGYAARISPIKTETGLSYRVRIVNLPSAKEAKALAEKLKGKLGITEPKVALK